MRMTRETQLFALKPGSTFIVGDTRVSTTAEIVGSKKDDKYRLRVGAYIVDDLSPSRKSDEMLALGWGVGIAYITQADLVIGVLAMRSLGIEGDDPIEQITIKLQELGGISILPTDEEIDLWSQVWIMLNT